MKSLFFLLISLLVVSSSYARECHDDVKVYFYVINEERQYDDQGISNGHLILEKGEKIVSNEVAVVNERKQTVFAYEGYSDDEKGFAVEVILVDPISCEILDIVRTYSDD